MNAEPSENPKIIVDEDWKSQVAREKESVKQEQSERPMSHELPPPSFAGLVQGVAAQAMAALSEAARIAAGEEIEGIPPDQLPAPGELVALAKHNIDTLGMLEEKTRNNLTPEEQAFLTSALHELRMIFVEMGGKIPSTAGTKSKLQLDT